ncbi:MAG TPA: WbqC family protein [Elusimicrobiota bacterium]|nr:WbqC family protein [Elusimicrobiota bacterium]
MIVAAHQPQYLPWLGYFHKMAHCDLFLFLDDVQYKKREFQNRNKIRMKDDTLWLTVPVLTKGHFDQNIRDVFTEPTTDWRESHWKSLCLSYSRSAHFPRYKEALEKIYRTAPGRLMDISMDLIRFQCEAFGIETPGRFSSEFSVTSSKSQRLVDLCLATKADTYLSGQGARDYLDETLFESAGIRVIYQDFVHPTYPQTRPGFLSHLCALDLLFNCGPDSRRHLTDRAAARKGDA